MNCARCAVYYSTLISLIFTGCGLGYQPVNERWHPVNERWTEDSRLAVTVPEPRKLRGVNSIAVALPRVNENAKMPVISPAEARKTIISTMREMLSIRISEHPSASNLSAQDEVSGASDCILSTDLIRIERRTSQLGGVPAIVSFRMSAVLAKTNELVWSGQFYYRQPTVTEDVLSLGAKGSGTAESVMRFKGAQEVFLEGVRLAIADFNARREEQFFH